MSKPIDTVVLALRSGGDFSFADVDLLCFHLRSNHFGPLRIICLYDKVDKEYPLINCTLIPPFNKDWPGWWTKMNLFAPNMEQYRPFLYVDLDTAIVNSINSLFLQYESNIVMLEDFYHENSLASGLMWIPLNSQVVMDIWNDWMISPEHHIKKYRGDQNFISNFIHLKKYWQRITNKICSFKVRGSDRTWLTELPEEISVVCFHGHPRIKEAVHIPWIDLYARQNYLGHPKVTVIIPYKTDRGWLQEAINSVPKWVQILVSQGEGTWPQNFNKVLDKATGDYIKFLHDDDLLSPNCISDSVQAINSQQVDFIQGKATDFYEDGTTKEYCPPKEITLEIMLRSNPLHGGSLMFHRRIFDTLGGFDETLNHAEEYEFVLRCLFNGFKIGYCDSSLYFYRRHSKQKSQIGASEIPEVGKAIANKYKNLCQKTN